MKRGHVTASLRDFWNRCRVVNAADPNSCWEWIGPYDTRHYPIYCGASARRIAALIDTGAIPGNVSMGCHGGTTCIRPAHIVRIGEPGRKSQTTGAIPIRYDLKLQEEAYKLRMLPDAEIAARLTTTLKIVRSLRLCFALFAIKEELEANKAAGIRAPYTPLGRFQSV